jgi:hypothetical protein
MFKKFRNKVAKWLQADEKVQTPNRKKMDSLYDVYKNLQTVVAIEETDATFDKVAEELGKAYAADFDKDELKAVFAQQYKQHLEDKLKGKTKRLKSML